MSKYGKFCILYFFPRCVVIMFSHNQSIRSNAYALRPAISWNCVYSTTMFFLSFISKFMYRISFSNQHIDIIPTHSFDSVSASTINIEQYRSTQKTQYQMCIKVYLALYTIHTNMTMRNRKIHFLNISVYSLGPYQYLCNISSYWVETHFTYTSKASIVFRKLFNYYFSFCKFKYFKHL